MWGSADRQRKRKADSDPVVPKSWKGRVLLQNKTVKKSETSTRKVVWFSSTDCPDLAGNITDLTNRVVCPDPIKARQCLDFELHFKMHKPFPPDVNLMVYAVLYKSDSAEEIKEGVVNNFSYIQRSQSHGVAVFEKLYLETRSQFSHFLEFTLWAERVVPNNGNDPGRNYDRETYYPVPGTNTYRTPHFIPSTPSKKASSQHSDEAELAHIEFLKIIPNKGEPNTTTYLTFSTRMREPSGQIFVVWNDQILHLPYYTKGGSERLVVLDKIPPSQTEVVPVYLKEKPPQDSHVEGFSSNVLYFHYTSLSSSTSLTTAPEQPKQFLSSRSTPVSFSSSLNHSSSKPSTESSSWNEPSYSNSTFGTDRLVDTRPPQRHRSLSTGGLPRQSGSTGHFTFNPQRQPPMQQREDIMDEESSGDGFGPPKELSNLRISSPNYRGNTSYSDSEDSGSGNHWCDPYEMATMREMKIKSEPVDIQTNDSVPNYQAFQMYPNQQQTNFSHSPSHSHPFGSHSHGQVPQLYTSNENLQTEPVPHPQVYHSPGHQQPQSHSPQSHHFHSSPQGIQMSPMAHIEEQRIQNEQLRMQQQQPFMQNIYHNEQQKSFRYSDPSPAQFNKDRLSLYSPDGFGNAGGGNWDQPQPSNLFSFDANSRFDFSSGASPDRNPPNNDQRRGSFSSRTGRLPAAQPQSSQAGSKTTRNRRHLSLPSQTDLNQFFHSQLHKIDEEREFIRHSKLSSGDEHEVKPGDSVQLVDSFFL
jgi:hypothetical protein